MTTVMAKANMAGLTAVQSSSMFKNLTNRTSRSNFIRRSRRATCDRVSGEGGGSGEGCGDGDG